MPTSSKKRTASHSPHFRLTRDSRARIEKEAEKDGSRTPAISYNNVITLEDVIEVLRHFDMDIRYGPCVGISRMDRWERAQRFELGPPQQIFDILTSEELMDRVPDLEKSLWDKLW